METARRERIVTWGCGLALSVLTGIVCTAQPWHALARFDMLHVVPLVVGLALVRSFGPALAAVVVSLQVTASLRAGAASSWRHAAIAALLVPVAFGPVTAVAMLSASVVTSLAVGVGPSAFVERLLRADFAFGFAEAAVLGLVPAVWTWAAPRLVRRVPGVSAALVVTWVTTALSSTVLGAVFAALAT